MLIDELRKNYHRRLNQEIVRVKKIKDVDCPNYADIASNSSRVISIGLFSNLGFTPIYDEPIKEQKVGDYFEDITKAFIEEAFALLGHLRPGVWVYSTSQTAISNFSQYAHLSQIKDLIKGNKELLAMLGRDYIVKPDIIVARLPVPDDMINSGSNPVIFDPTLATLTDLRKANQKKAILHASISCKWTIRSDRAQNTRTETLNLIRNRKGNLPHVVAVTAEPLPTRIAALALGTGDLDCVYHFALPELQKTLTEQDNQDQREMLDMLVSGKRLRDISDLPFDLAI